jgi:catechol 2,3-dioxygenase-like lactoylglutathione lyase family enzyme
MIDHLSLGVADLGRSATFYDAVLGALGYVRKWTSERGVGYGSPEAQPDEEPFAIVEQLAGPRAGGAACHVAFTAPTRGAVVAFHAAALVASGTDEGPPGLRPKYGPGYYAAFVRDLDGHKLEAVCHERA